MSNTDNNLNNKEQSRLKVIAINVNSIITNARRQSLANTLKKLKPDIALISETKLNNRHHFTLADYSIVRNDRETDSGGGTALLIKNNIKFSIIAIKNKLKILEVSIIQIKLQKNKKLFIISAYAPRESNRNFIDDLDIVFNELKLQDTNSWYVLAGDLNARHPLWSDTSNHRGIYLSNWIEENEFTYRNCLYGPEKPTFPRSKAFLDLAICDSRLDITNLKEDKLKVFPFDSDHRGITFTIELPNELKIIIENSKEHEFNFAKADWEAFQEFLKENAVPIPNNNNLTNNEIDSHLTDFNTLIQQAIKHAVPRYKKKDSFKKYTNPRINKLQKIKSKLVTNLFKLKRKGNNDEEIGWYEYLIKENNKKIHKEFAISISNYWKNRIKAISTKNSKELFPEINKIFRFQSRQNSSILKIPQNKYKLLDDTSINVNNLTKDGQNNYILDQPADILNIIGAHFASVNIQNHNLGKPALDNIITKRVSEMESQLKNDEKYKKYLVEFNDTNSALNPTFEEDKNFFCNTGLLIFVLKKLRNKKSTGIDGIPNLALKHLHIRTIINLTVLFNNMLNNGYFPEMWKTAKVCPIIKKNKKGDQVADYRPISLLPNTSKVFEIVVNKAIDKFTFENNIIHDSQFGFRYEHSTVHAISKLQSDVCEALNKGEFVGACLIDLEKAFDTVNIEGLFFKMLKKNTRYTF